MNSGKNLLTLLASISSSINEGVEALQNQKVTNETLTYEIQKNTTKAAVRTIEEIGSGNSVAVNEYGNFYMSIIQRFLGDDNRSSFIVDDRYRYIISENTMTSTYILTAYLIRTNNIDAAKSILNRKVRGKLENHYVARTVYTLRSRAGIEKYSRGWCIGIGEKLFKRDKELQSLFFHDNEKFLDLLCQVDFLQYYLEFKKSNDLYHGYPNFLYYPKKHVDPLITTLEEQGEDKIILEEVVAGLARINAGEFFTQNRWRH